MEEKLSISEFQELLEYEFIQYAISMIFFDKEYEEKYYQKMVSAYVKIDDIQSKILSSTIFNSEERFNKVLDDIIKPKGFPNFRFRNESATKIKNVLIANLFSNGTIVVIDKLNWEVIGVIPKEEVIIAKGENEEIKKFNLNEVDTTIYKSEVVFKIEEVIKKMKG